MPIEEALVKLPKGRGKEMEEFLIKHWDKVIPMPSPIWEELVEATHNQIADIVLQNQVVAYYNGPLWESQWQFFLDLNVPT
jgi:hypothetical protein